jgi:hypothetical protein
MPSRTDGESLLANEIYYRGCTVVDDARFVTLYRGNGTYFNIRSIAIR